MSLFFERRAFCSHLCFLGGLSGNYSMTSSLAFRANLDNCKKVGCKDLWCANGSERAAACPLYETPRTMDSNRDCNMCGNCVKSCPHGSLRLEVRKPTSEFWNIRKPRLDVAFLAIVLVGVVIVQNLTMLGVYPTILEHVAMFTGTDNVNVNFTVVFLVAMIAPIAAAGRRELRLVAPQRRRHAARLHDLRLRAHPARPGGAHGAQPLPPAGRGPRRAALGRAVAGRHVGAAAPRC